MNWEHRGKLLRFQGRKFTCFNGPESAMGKNSSLRIGLADLAMWDLYIAICTLCPHGLFAGCCPRSKGT